MRRKRSHKAFKLTLFLVGLFFATVVLAVLSLFFAYVPSRGTEIFCYYVMPALIVALVVAYRAFRYIKFKRQGTAFRELDEPFRTYASLIVCSWLLGTCVSQIPAIPTELFARDSATLPVRVDRLSGFRADHGHWVWVYFAGGANKFLWTWSDPVVAKLGPGDCIDLHARRWIFGFYVDSVSDSSRCASQAGV